MFGVSCQANGGPSSSENRAHRPGGDGESCPGGVRSLLQGQWGAIFFSGQWNSCNALPHCLGAVDSATPAMRCLTVPEQWAVELLQCTTSLPWGSGQWNSCNALPHCLGAVGSGTPAMHCLTAWGQRAVDLLQCTASLPWGSGQCSFCNALPHCLGAVGSGTPAVTGRTGLGGTGSPAQGVVGTSCKAHGEPSSSNNRAHRPGGDGESSPGGGRSLLPGPMGCHLLQRTGRNGPGGTGSPAQGVFGVYCQANGWPSSSENRAHRPGGDGESCPGDVRSLLPGQWGAIFFREPGAPARGGRGVLPRGCSDPPARAMGGHLLQRTGRTGLEGTGSPAQGVFGVSCKASGGPSSLENRAHRPGGDGETCPGGVRSLLQGQWGAIFFREPGAPAWGGRGVLPRRCSESPARPVGGHLLQWAVELLQCTAPLLGGSGQCNSCNALPHCPRAVGSGTPAMHYLTALGKWAVELLQCTASLPGGSGQWNPCNALPHCLGAAGSGPPAMHCLTAWGQWAVELLQ